jgi:hypothetical protein
MGGGVADMEFSRGYGVEAPGLDLDWIFFGRFDLRAQALGASTGFRLVVGHEDS